MPIAALLAASGCGGPGAVRFEHEICTIDGRVADLPRVEEREAEVQRRITGRQPWLVAITIVVVSMAGISYIERLILLFSASRETQGVGERLRRLVDRYRAHRIRYAAIVAGSVGLLVAAGVTYIYLDADKRSSERALATLQFCHLALRTADEKRALDEQRRNLGSIHDTAGEIRQLIDKLPPAEQAKAEEIIGHMDEAVGRQGRLLADRLHRSEDAATAIRERTQSIERQVTDLGAGIGGLKDLPGGVHTLTELMHRLEGRAATAEGRLSANDEKLAAIQRSLGELSSRPAPACPTCPACVCGAERPAGTAEKTEAAGPRAARGAPPEPASAGGPAASAEP